MVRSWSPGGHVTQEVCEFQGSTFCLSGVCVGGGLDATLGLPLSPPLMCSLGAQAQSERPHALPPRLSVAPTVKSGPLEAKPPPSANILLT